MFEQGSGGVLSVSCSFISFEPEVSFEPSIVNAVKRNPKAFRIDVSQNTTQSLPSCDVINGHYFDSFREKKNLIYKNEDLLGQ